MTGNMSDIPPTTPDDDLTYINIKIPLERAVYESNQVLKGARRRAKDIGVDIKAADYVEACRKKGEKGRAHIRSIISFALLTGMFERSDLTNLADSNVSASEQVMRDRLLVTAEDSGRQDGWDGISQEDSPFPLDSEHHARWLKGLAGGAAARQLELGLDGKLASATRELPKARRERKSVSVVSDHPNGNGSVLPKRRGRPPGVKNKPKPVIEEAMHAA